MMDLSKFQLHLYRVFAACVIYVHFNSFVSAAPEISPEFQTTELLSQKEGHRAIKEFQRFSGLPETGRKEAAAEIPDLCQDASIDAATITEDGRKYVFKGDYYFELTGLDFTRIADGYPRKISQDWNGLPGQLDAALTWENGTTLFFKRNQYWSFRNKKMDSGYPREISDGFPEIPNNVDAALVWGENGKAYFFKGSNYWRYVAPNEPHNGYMYPQPISDWTGLPDNIEAALGWNNQYSYFFKGTGYYRFDNKLSKVSTDNGAHYPFSTSVFWFGC